MPITFANPDDYDMISEGDTLELTNIEEAVTTGADFDIVINGAKGTKTIKGKNSMAERSRNIIKAGGLAAYTRAGGQ